MVFSCDKHVRATKEINGKRAWMKNVREPYRVHYLCKFSVNLKLLQNKRFIFRITGDSKFNNN